MNPLLQFKKNKKKKNILFDEFFAESSVVEFIAFNYDAEGSALCRCDGELRKIEKGRVNKILLGASKARIDSYMRGIFDQDHFSEDVIRVGGEVRFRLQELNEIDKYELGNLAKKTHKELQKEEIERLVYFVEVNSSKTACASNRRTKKGNKKSESLRGNANSRVFHYPGCRSYAGKGNTERFAARKEAVAAGYNPCKLCGPKKK
jgi:hypothetical protein